MAATSADWPSHLVCCTHNFGSKEWPSPLLACHPPADVVGRLIFSPGKKASAFSEPVLKCQYLFPASLLFQEENRRVDGKATAEEIPSDSANDARMSRRVRGEFKFQSCDGFRFSLLYVWPYFH